MYNLLLVDDEPGILDGLTYNVDWNSVEIENVYRAENARDSLAVLEEHRIDLVITDIKMPGRDGLSMSEQILSRWPYTKIIFLSGYKDFEYVQKAIDVKAFRYVLKPVRYEELEELARMAIAELKQELQKQYFLETAQKQIDHFRPFFQERYLYLWLVKDAVRPWENPEAFRNGEMDLGENDLGFCVLIRKEQGPGADAAEVAVSGLARRMLDENGRMLSFLGVDDNQSLLFFGEDPNWMESFFHRTVERLETFQFAVQETFHCAVSLFWGFPSSIREFGENYRSVRRQANRRVVSAAGAILGPEVPDTQAHGTLSSMNGHPSFPSLVGTLQFEDAGERMARIFRELEAPEKCTWENCLQVYYMILGTLIADSAQRGIALHEWNADFQELFESTAVLSSFSRFRALCMGAADAYFSYVHRNQATQNGKLVDRIRQIVSQELGTELSVGTLARRFNYNAAYLSRVFKDETGEALQDYMIHARIEKAKELLENGTRIGDVSASVGYENLPHFSRIFKKTVGVSPKQYQEKCGPCPE